MGYRPFSYGQFGRVPDPPEPPEDLGDKLHIGDWIRCHDKEDMVSTMMELAEAGVDTDFRYERGGKKGLWLEILEVHDED